MRKKEKAKLHEDDKFIQFMRKVGARIMGRRRVLRLIVLILVVGLAAVVTTTVLHAKSIEARRTAIDKASTLEEMEPLAQKYPRDFQLLRKMGLAYAVQGGPENFAKAEQALTTAVGVAPSDLDRAVMQTMLGKVKMDLGKYEEGAAIFEEAAGVPDARPLIGEEANWYAGLCYEKQQQPDKALEKYRRVITESPAAGGTVWEMLAAHSQAQVHMN